MHPLHTIFFLPNAPAALLFALLLRKEIPEFVCGSGQQGSPLAHSYRIAPTSWSSFIFKQPYTILPSSPFLSAHHLHLNNTSPYYDQSFRLWNSDHLPHHPLLDNEDHLHRRQVSGAPLPEDLRRHLVDSHLKFGSKSTRPESQISRLGDRWTKMLAERS